MRLLPDYTPGMATKVETRMQVQSKLTSKTNEDASVILNMDDVKRNKNASKRNSSNISNKSERYSLFYEASLILDNVKPNQSGNYTCGPSNSLSASVRLHITQGNCNLIINIFRWSTTSNIFS
jgi:hypothetical protein